METALLQNGASLPSEETIMCIIEEKFESNRRDTEDTCDKNPNIIMYGFNIYVKPISHNKSYKDSNKFRVSIL